MRKAAQHNLQEFMLPVAMQISLHGESVSGGNPVLCILTDIAPLLETPRFSKPKASTHKKDGDSSGVWILYNFVNQTDESFSVMGDICNQMFIAKEALEKIIAEKGKAPASLNDQQFASFLDTAIGNTPHRPGYGCPVTKNAARAFLQQGTCRTSERGQFFL